MDVVSAKDTCTLSWMEFRNPSRVAGSPSGATFPGAITLALALRATGRLVTRQPVPLASGAPYASVRLATIHAPGDREEAPVGTLAVQVPSDPLESARLAPARELRVSRAFAETSVTAPS